MHSTVCLLLFVLITVCNTQDTPCASRDVGGTSTICVCNSTYCDTISRPQQVAQPNILIYTSNQAGLRFELTANIFTDAPPSPSTNQITINHDVKYQEILGWGAAFTDSAGINLLSLYQNARNNLLRSYFSDEGIEYNQCRVPMGGTDFSTRAYSYDDSEEPDPELVNFALTLEDLDIKIPIILQALDMATTAGIDLRLFTSTWTAPKWMKTNGDYAGLLGYLKPEMFQPWADYFVKFLDEYAERGIQFWGITTGNEPSLALIPFNLINNVGWEAVDAATWVANNLGPTIRESNHSDIKIMCLDDQRLFLTTSADTVLSDPVTNSFVDGVAVHWYLDSFTSPDLLTETHTAFPTKFLLATEACSGSSPLDITKVLLGSWERGNDYSHSIIQDLLHWVGGWTDWNFALDVTGGPTYINNNVDAPIIVNSMVNEFYKQPMYYHLGHFSKFIPRGSVRVDSSFVGTVEIVALEKPDGGTVVVILNKDSQQVDVTISDNLVNGSANLQIGPNSITTVLYW